MKYSRNELQHDTLPVFNTHFRHGSDQTREESANLVLLLTNKLADSKAVILTGDFNFTRNTDAYNVLSTGYKGIPGLVDIGFYLNAYKDRITNVNGFGRAAQNRIIDFVWTNEYFTALKYRIIEAKEGDVFISDHYPVVCDLKW